MLTSTVQVSILCTSYTQRYQYSYSYTTCNLIFWKTNTSRPHTVLNFKSNFPSKSSSFSQNHLIFYAQISAVSVKCQAWPAYHLYLCLYVFVWQTLLNFIDHFHNGLYLCVVYFSSLWCSWSGLTRSPFVSKQNTEKALLHSTFTGEVCLFYIRQWTRPGRTCVASSQWLWWRSSWNVNDFDDSDDRNDYDLWL